METLEKTLANVEVNAEGYLKKIVLTDKHFEVINWLRAKQAEGTALSMRKVGASGLVDIKQFYALFPGGPLKISSKIAGIPKPASCI
jgi:tRNA 2-thiouridine synthesizing protein E